MRQLLRFSDAHTMLLWASIVGVAGALATIAFREGISGLQYLIVGHSGSLVDMATHLPWYIRFVTPAVGGLAAGCFLLLARRMAVKRALSDYMEAITIGDGKLPVRQNLLRSVSSLCTIATGGSIGREGSMIQLAALASSLVGRFAHFDPPRLRLLVACGAAAGITSAYNAPIAGAFFVTEIVLGSIAMESFGPIVVASVIANITMREFAGYRPPYEMPAFPAISGVEVILFVGLGLLCGVAAPPFLRLLELSKRAFGKVALPLPLRLGLGGLAVGILSIWVPEVWGNGYSVVNSILHESWTWQMLLLVLVMKVAATAFTTGSGAVGGVFTPTLFVGAAVGCLYGLGVHGLWPHGSAPFAYAIVGMGAFLAAATSAPLMAILMIFEMTLSYQVVLPLMLSCVVAYFLARTFGETSMYEVTATRNRRLREQARLRATQMRALIKPADTILPLDAALSDMTRVFLEYPVKYIYITDAAQHFKGVVALQDITSHLLAADKSTKTAADFIRTDFRVLTPDMSLGDALELFVAFQGERLPVVETIVQPVLLGVVYKSSLLDAYFRMNGAE
jgi:CIC family chloride channel protein